MVHQWVGQAGWGAGQQTHPSQVLPASVTISWSESLQYIKQANASDVYLV